MKLSHHLVGLTLVGMLALVVACGETDEGTGPPPTSTDPPVIDSFLITALDSRVTHGDFATLRWRVSGATIASITPAIGQVNAAAGDQSIRPHEPIEYTLLVSNGFGSDTATVAVDVDYRRGVYVSSSDGDDASDGSSPNQSVQTFGRAFELGTQNNTGVFFVAAGIYDASVSIGSQQFEVYGALDPETFFERPNDPAFATIFQPSSGVPVSIDATAQSVIFSDMTIRAPAGASSVLRLENAGNSTRPVQVLRCTLDGRDISSGTVVDLSGSGVATFRGCQIRGARLSSGGAAVDSARGFLVRDTARLTLCNSFVDAGNAREFASGVEVRTSGEVGLGLNTIVAQATAFAGLPSSAAVRIYGNSNTSLGGNILATRGQGLRYGVAEEMAGSNPMFMEGNLFVSVGPPAYLNFDGPNADAQNELNDPFFTTSGVVFENVRVTNISATQLFRDINAGDFHLLRNVNPDNGPPVLNPAVDRAGDAIRRPEYGAPRPPDKWLDIDGEERPVPAQTDIGADEN